MASRILQLRRGTKAAIPSSLSLGELGYCTDTKEVFVGNGVGNTLVNPLVSLNGDTGLLIKTGSETFVTRSIDGGDFITVADGDAVSGNPTISVDYRDEDDMASNSDQHLATQQSIKAYVDSVISTTAQTGIQDIADATNTIVVTLPVEYSDTSYSISSIIQNTADSTPSQFAVTVVSKSTTGFTLELSGNTDSANYKLAWITRKQFGTTQVGTESLSNGATQVSVTLSQAYTSTDYGISSMLENTVDSNPSQYAMTVISKSTTRFTVEFSGSMDSANYSYNWTTYA